MSLESEAIDWVMGSRAVRVAPVRNYSLSLTRLPLPLWQCSWIGPLAPIGSLLFPPEKPKGEPSPAGILTVHEGRVGGVPMCED